MNGNWIFRNCSDVFPFSGTLGLLNMSTDRKRNSNMIYTIETFKSSLNLTNDDCIRFICAFTNEGDKGMKSNSCHCYVLKSIQCHRNVYGKYVYSILESDTKFENLSFYSYGPIAGHRRYVIKKLCTIVY